MHCSSSRRLSRGLIPWKRSEEQFLRKFGQAGCILRKRFNVPEELSNEISRHSDVFQIPGMTWGPRCPVMLCLVASYKSWWGPSSLNLSILHLPTFLSIQLIMLWIFSFSFQISHKVFRIPLKIPFKISPDWIVSSSASCTFPSVL